MSGLRGFDSVHAQTARLIRRFRKYFGVQIHARLIIAAQPFVIWISFSTMNQTTLVHIAERLEGLAGKLPEKIRRPVLRELVPLKQLFLQQRRPRFLFIGSSKTPMPEIIDLLFAPDSHDGMNVTLTPVHRWTEWTIPGQGTISILDARDAGDSARTQIQDEFRREPADMIFFFDDGESHLNQTIDVPPSGTKIIGLSLGSATRVTELEAGRDAHPN